MCLPVLKEPVTERNPSPRLGYHAVPESIRADVGQTVVIEMRAFASTAAVAIVSRMMRWGDCGASRACAGASEHP